MHWQYPPADPGGAGDLLDERINSSLGTAFIISVRVSPGATHSLEYPSDPISGKGNRQAIDSKFGCGISKATGLAVNADH